MSMSGNAAMAVLRLIKPGKGGFTDYEKAKSQAARENAAFSFKTPRSRRCLFELMPGTEKPCLIIRPKRLKCGEKAVLYIYGGVTNNWNTQLSMAIGFACDTGLETWYPVYPSVTEAPYIETVRYIAEIYRRMTERFPPEKIGISGVSMGGSFALNMVSLINRESLKLHMPGLIIAHSPGGSADCEEDWELFRKYESRDPLFAEGDLKMIGRLTPGGAEPDWLFYPARGDFTGAPPTYIYYGEELLAGNAPLYKRAFDRCGAGNRLHIEIAQNMMHGYSCMPVFPESRRSYYETVRLIDEL